MAYLEILHTCNALAGLAALLFVGAYAKRSLKQYARTGFFR